MSGPGPGSLTIRVHRRDGVAEVCGPADDVLAVLGLVWGSVGLLTLVRRGGTAAINWGLRVEES